MTKTSAFRLRKLPARHTPLVQSLILTGIMTFVVAGIATLKALGFVPGFFGAWISAWILSWIVAFPTMMLAMPLVRRLVALLVEPPSAK